MKGQWHIRIPHGVQYIKQERVHGIEYNTTQQTEGKRQGSLQTDCHKAVINKANKMTKTNRKSDSGVGLKLALRLRNPRPRSVVVHKHKAWRTSDSSVHHHSIKAFFKNRHLRIRQRWGLDSKINIDILEQNLSFSWTSMDPRWAQPKTEVQAILN